MSRWQNRKTSIYGRLGRLLLLAAAVGILAFLMLYAAGMSLIDRFAWDGNYLAREGMCAVEWSENILDALPPGTLYVKLDKRSETHRHITVYREEGTTCAY